MNIKLKIPELNNCLIEQKRTERWKKFKWAYRLRWSEKILSQSLSNERFHLAIDFCPYFIDLAIILTMFLSWVDKEKPYLKTLLLHLCQAGSTTMQVANT